MAATVTLRAEAGCKAEGVNRDGFGSVVVRVSRVCPFQALVCPYRSRSPVTHPNKSPFCGLSAAERGSGGGGSEHAWRGALVAARQMQMDRMAADSGGTAHIDPRPAAPVGRTRTPPLSAPGETAAAIRSLPWHWAGVCRANLFLPRAVARTKARDKGRSPSCHSTGTQHWGARGSGVEVHGDRCGVWVQGIAAVRAWM